MIKGFLNNVCRHCSKQFSQRQKLDKHQMIPNCSRCQQAFSCKTCLSDHRKTCKFSCSSCQKQFAKKESLKKHEKFHANSGAPRAQFQDDDAKQWRCGVSTIKRDWSVYEDTRNVTDPVLLRRLSKHAGEQWTKQCTATFRYAQARESHLKSHKHLCCKCLTAWDSHH